MEDKGPTGDMMVTVGGTAGRSSASVDMESQMTGDIVTSVGRAGVARLIRMGAGLALAVSGFVGTGW